MIRGKGRLLGLIQVHRYYFRSRQRLLLLAGCRLDHSSGTGFHINPRGVEFDERVLGLGNNLTLRGAAAVKFPRQFPIDEDNPEASFGFEVHRLTLKTPW